MVKGEKSLKRAYTSRQAKSGKCEKLYNFANCLRTCSAADFSTERQGRANLTEHLNAGFGFPGWGWEVNLI